MLWLCHKLIWIIKKYSLEAKSIALRPNMKLRFVTAIKGPIHEIEIRRTMVAIIPNLHKKLSKPSIGFLGQQQSRAFHIASAEELVRDNGLAARYVYVGSCPLAYCHLVFPLDWLRKKRTPYMHKANGPSYTTSHWKRPGADLGVAPWKET